MWRAYELVEDGEFWTGPHGSAEMKKHRFEGMELSGPGLLPHALDNDVVHCERMVHIPPGFLSC